MARNPLLDALMRIQPTASRMDFPEGGGFDDTAALQGFADRQAPADPLGALRGGRKAELTERIFNEKRAPNKFMPGQLDALGFLLKGIEQDEAEDPLQQEMVANQRARLSGFPTSAAAGEYARGMEEIKALSPLRSAQATAQGGVQKQGIASQAAIDRERMIQRTKGDIASGQQETFKELGSMLTPGSSISVPGAGSMRTPAPPRQQPVVNPQLLQTITALRNQPKTAQNTAAMSQAINNALATSNYDADIRNTVANILNDEMYSRMKPEDVGADLLNDKDNTPEDIMQVVEALRLFMEQQPQQ